MRYFEKINFKKHLFSLLAFFLIIHFGVAQTNPTAQSLPFSFSSITGSTLPAGIAIHSFSALPTTRTTSTPSGDLTYTSSSTSGGWKDEGSSGLSLLGSGSQNTGAMVVAINTTSLSSIVVSWKAGTVLQQSSRDNSIALQYRVGTSGTFTDVGTTSTYSSSGKSNGDLSSLFTETLPTGAENQSVVQLRFVYWESTSTSGSRDRLNLTAINVSGTTPPPSTQASSITFSSIDVNSMTSSWTNGNGSNRVVKMNTSNSFTTPTNGTSPSANTTWANSGEQFVYNGSGSTVSVTGLAANTTYWFRVYEYNGTGSATSFASGTATNNPNSQATLANATNPTAQSLPFTFSSLTGSALPAGMAVHAFSAVPTTRTSSAPSTDLIYNSTSTNGGWRDESSNGISLLGSGSAKTGALVVSVNTTGKTNIQVSWKVGTILQQASCDNSLALQYRVGTSGTFTDLGSTSTYSSAGKSNGDVSGLFTETLPIGAENAAVIQLRWVYWESTVSTGAMDRINITSISVENAPTTQASNITFSSVASTTLTTNWTSGNGSNRVVKMNTSNSFTALTNGTSPSANAAWANAGEQVVYNGTGSSVAITALAANTTYWFAVYEYNGSGVSVTYSTATGSGNPNSQLTPPSSTNPTAQSLPFTFTSLTGNTLPAGMAVHAFNSLPTTRTGVISATDLSYNSTSTTGGWRDEAANGLSLLGSATTNTGALVVALNTTGKTNIQVSWKAGTVLQQASCDNSVALQYRVGTSGTFTDVGSLSTYTSSSKSSGDLSALYTETLPVGAENAAVIQLRWVYWESTVSTGAMDRINFTSITVNNAPTTQASAITFSNVLGNSMTAGWTSGNGSKRVVKMNTSNSFAALVNEISPTADTTWHNSGEQVVYNGSGSAVSVSGLLPNTTYWFEVYEYNGTATSIVYNNTTATSNPNSQLTPLIPTNPTAQNLPFTFSSLTGSTLPAGMAVHAFSSLPVTRTNSAPSVDLAYASGSTTGGWRDEGSSGLSILGTASDNAGGLVVAVNTTGKTNIQVSWQAGTILQQASRDNSIALQYRVGTSGTFTDVGTTSTYSSTGKASGDLSSLFTETLPVGAENAAVIQLRWVYWESNSTSGARDRINLTSIVVNSAPTTQALNITFTNVNSISMTTNWTNGNGSKRVVKMNTSNSFTALGNGSSPTADTVFHNVGEQVIYNGTGSSVSVTGLTISTTYWYEVYEYNGTGTSIVYNNTTSTNNPNSQSTSTAANNPTAQTLPFTFSSLSGTTLPAGMAVHSFSTLPTTRTNAAPLDNLRNSATSTEGGWEAESASGISLLGSGSANTGALVVAINTTGKSNIQVSWKAGTVLQQASRDNSIALQYRVGTTGNFTDVGTTSTYNSSGKSAGDLSSLYLETLPVGAENQAVVQIRWVYWESNSTSGSRDRLNLTAITVNSAPATQASNITFSNINLNAMTASWTNGNGTNRLVKMNTSNSFTSPTAGSSPIANTTWSNAGEQVVSNGTVNTVNIKGLTRGTTYWFRVYEYYGTGSTTNFATATATNNPNSQATLSCGTIVSRNGGGNWTDTSRWTPSVVPIACDSVVITSGNPITIAAAAGAKAVNILTGGTLTVNNSLSLNASLLVNGAFNYGTGTSSNLIFNSAGTQNISGTGTMSVYAMQVNKSAGALTLNRAVSIDNTLTLTAGNIVTTSTNLLTMNSGSAITGGSDGSHVYGPIQKIGNSAFSFPLGTSNLTSGAYHPVSISAPSVTTDAFTAQYFRAGQTDGNGLDYSITNLSTCEYWNLNHTTGTSAVSVTLGWNPNTCDTTTPPNMRIASWNPTLSIWKDLGGINSTGTSANGTIKTASTLTIFGDFTLANKGTLNVYFRTVANGNWNQASTWQASVDNSNWLAASTIPDFNSNTITIQSGNTVTITSSVSIDQTTVNGTLIYGDNAGSTLTLNDGTGTDLTVNGTYQDIGPNSNVWSGSATWSLGASATILRTRATSADLWRDHYAGGISTIPATATWIVSKTGADDPLLSSVGGMYYPNLIIQNNSGSAWTPAGNSIFTGSTDYPRILGTLDIGGAGTSTVVFTNQNTNATKIPVAGDLIIRAGSTLQDNGTGFNVAGNIQAFGTYAPGSDLTVPGNFTISAGGSLNTNNHNVTLGGNWIDNGSVNTGTGAVIFNGTADQSITMAAGAETFTNFTVNKVAGNVVLNAPLTVSSVLTLTKGVILSTSTNILELTNTGSVVGGTDASYVSGPMDKIGNTAFVFPLGSGAINPGPYHPLAISAPAVTTDEFIAQYYPVGQGYGSVMDDSLLSVNPCEYWTLNRAGGTSSVQVQLGWNINNCFGNDYADYRVAAWDGTTWRNKGQNSFAFNGNIGNVISSIGLTFSPTIQALAISKLNNYNPFAILKRKLDGGYSQIFKGKLSFIYPEEYNDVDGLLTYNIYDWKHNLLLSNATASPGNIPMVKFGDNRYSLNLLDPSLGIMTLSNGSYYILEVINEKNEKWYLRFAVLPFLTIPPGGG